MLDMVFPAVYAALFALIGAIWAERSGASSGWTVAALACTVGAGLSDYVENVLLLRMLGALPHRRDQLVANASRFTKAKFVFSALTPCVPLAHWGLAHAA